MNKKQFLIWQVVAIIFSIFVGALLHFVYEWSGENKLIAAIGATNESTWQHLKIAFVPMVIFAFLESFFIKSNSYWKGKVFGILTALVLIVVLFYSYTGVLGYNVDAINIIIFALSISVGEIVASFVIFQNNTNSSPKIKYIIFLMLLAAVFVIFTYNPPQINLFMDPITGEYGI